MNPVLCVSREARISNGTLTMETPTPYSQKPLLDNAQDFHFAIIADRGGGERKGIFAKTMKALNLLRPEFSICVGDLMEGVFRGKDQADLEARIKMQSDELDTFINSLDMRFYHVVGNHDISLGLPGNNLAHHVTKKEWQNRHGKTYYDFMYKDCHFVCLDSMDGRDGRLPVQGISDEQYQWAKNTILQHKDARWTFIFMHMPLDWTSDKFLAFEKDINAVDYTLFCGDWHNHVKATRHGKDYYMLGTCGGVWNFGVTSDDLRYGIMDAITWVTVTDHGPVIANLQLSGIFGDEVQRCATSQGWIEAPLDYPDHFTVNDGLDAERTGDGYDWHFRHAMILRNGSYVIKPDIVIAGDGVIHRWGALNWYGDTSYPRPPELNTDFFNRHRVMNMGCIGDRNENLLWRIRHGELNKVSPVYIILHIGSENLRAGDSPQQTAEGILRNIRAIHTACCKAKIKLLLPLEKDVPHKEETAAFLRNALADDANVELLDLSTQYAEQGVAALEAHFLATLDFQIDD